MPSMPRIPFGRTGLHVAPLGIGCIDPGLGGERVAALTERLLDAGANLVDTAQIYGDHEELIGRHLAHRRADMILVSKCGHHEVLPDGSMRSLPISMADIDGALQRLRTDHLDAMLLHSYDYEPLVRGDAIAVLVAARDAGKIRFLGYSGDRERAAWAASHPDISIIESSLNIVDQHNADHLLPLCRDHQVGVIAKRPLANAAWRFDDPDDAHESVRPYIDRFAAMDLQAQTYGCEDLGELALRFALGLDGLHCLIIGSRSESNQDRNLAAIAAGPLPTEVHQLLRQRWQAVARPDWLGVN